MASNPLADLVAVGVLASMTSGAAYAAAQTGTGGADTYTWQWQVRAVYLDPSSQTAFGGLTGKLYGELAGEWRLARDWSTEVAVGFPTYFPVKGIPNDRIRIMANTWTAKYGLAPERTFRPFIGAGVHFDPLSLDSRDRALSIDSTSFGWVAQAGFDVSFSGSYFVSADVRYLGNLEPRSLVGGSPAGARLKIDPLLFGVGIGARY